MSSPQPSRLQKKGALDEFVDRYLVVRDAKCYRHCQAPANFVSLKAQGAEFVGAYVCPGRYVSRVVYFSLQPDREWYERYLNDQIGDLVRSRDIRIATRHGWELGGDAEGQIKKIAPDGVKQLYWTLYPASDKEKTSGAFLCANGDRMFVKPFSEDTKLCPDCSQT